MLELLLIPKERDAVWKNDKNPGIPDFSRIPGSVEHSGFEPLTPTLPVLYAGFICCQHGPSSLARKGYFSSNAMLCHLKIT